MSYVRWNKISLNNHWLLVLENSWSLNKEVSKEHLFRQRKIIKHLQMFTAFSSHLLLIVAHLEYWPTNCNTLHSWVHGRGFTHSTKACLEHYSYLCEKAAILACIFNSIYISKYIFICMNLNKKLWDTENDNNLLSIPWLATWFLHSRNVPNSTKMPFFHGG